MSRHSFAESRRFHFALPRLLAVAGGGSGAAAESNWIEAYGTGIVVYAISYLYLAGFIGDHSPAASVTLLTLLLFGTWLCWLPLLYLNSLLVAGLRAVNLVRGVPNSSAQGVIIGLETTLFALALIRRDDYSRFVGATWLTGTAINLLATVALAFISRIGKVRDA